MVKRGKKYYYEEKKQKKKHHVLTQLTVRFFFFFVIIPCKELGAEILKDCQVTVNVSHAHRLEHVLDVDTPSEDSLAGRLPFVIHLILVQYLKKI